MYLDDIVVFLKSRQDHIEPVTSVQRLRYKSGVTLKVKKRKLFAETIGYLGHVIWRGHLEIAEHSAVAVAKIEHPTVQTVLSSSFGLCYVFSRSVSKFARLAAFPM